MSNYQYCNNFINSQYEDINGGRFLFREHVNAKYIKQEDTNCKGNLLIEALPPTQNLDQIFDFLKKFPEYSEEERNFSNEYRMHAIFRLLDFFMPLSANLLTSEYLSIIMRRGYIDKKIGTPSYVKLIRNANEDLINNNSYDLITSVVSNPSNGFLVIGASGGGKTTGLNNSLSYYPQVIHHVIENDGLRGYFTQIPWVRIDCSNDGKIPGVCNNFFEEIDRLLGTNYINQYGNHSTISKMINSIRFLTLKYAVGVLVVDEIQHIGNTIGGEQLLNFFVTLTNMIKIPIVYIGTYKASKTILGNQYRQGRKAEGIGVAEYRYWNKIVKNGTYLLKEFGIING